MNTVTVRISKASDRVLIETPDGMQTSINLLAGNKSAARSIARAIEEICNSTNIRTNIIFSE